MTRALADLHFAAAAGAPFLIMLAAFVVVRVVERPRSRKPVCGLEYEFTTAALWDEPEKFRGAPR